MLKFPRLRAATILALASLVIPAFARDDSAAEKLGLHLSLQCWTFNYKTAYEAIDMAKGMGIKYIEFYPGQKLKADSGSKVGPGMSADDLAALKQKLADNGQTAISFGVTGLNGNEGDKATFEFAKSMGIQIINSEPDEKNLAAIDKMATTYGIKVCLHNHPTPSRYWNNDHAFDSIKDLGPQMGLCADIGHWQRSGIRPLDALQKHGSRVKTFHFKDLAKFGDKGARDVVWGTGVGEVEKVLAEAVKQGLRCNLSVEYETPGGAEKEKEVAQCVTAFDEMCARIAAAKK